MEFADGGTFFLDEVGELPVLLQAKLLRALQERRIRRVGGKSEIPVDVRVVAATGRDLDKEVQEGAFREDLLYRLNVVTVQLPPLRERGEEEIRLLAQHFVHAHAKGMHKEVEGFSGEAMEVLVGYRWPGNVRELQNVVRRGIALTREQRITVDDLPERLVESAGVSGSSSEGESELGFFDLRNRRIAAFEREYLARVLQEQQGDVVAAAKHAQIPRGTYYRLLKNHGLKAADYRE